MAIRLQGKVFSAGQMHQDHEPCNAPEPGPIRQAQGPLLFTRQPFSFLGGVNPQTGVIVDPHHELCGRSMTGTIFAYPFNKGSSGAGLIILELARSRAQPAGIVCITPELVMLAGPCISTRLYDVHIPVCAINEHDFFHSLSNKTEATINSQTGILSLL